ncbi:MAG: methyl-accepting chemotaxis protein [Bdellovibrionota bacterium]|nr:MAG: hypothetical protein EOP10_16610 [Pseudomonadota bacterium]
MKNLSINAKFSLVIGVFVVTVLGVFSLGLYNVAKVKESARYIAEEVTERRLLTNRTLLAMYQATVDQRDLIMIKDHAGKLKTHEDMKLSVADAKENLGKLKAKVDSEHTERVAKVSDDFDRWVDLAEKAALLSEGGKSDEAFVLMAKEGDVINSRLETDLLSLMKDFSQIVIDSIKADQVSYERSRNFGITLSLLGLLIGSSLAAFISRAITRSIDHMVHTLSDSATQIASASKQISGSAAGLAETASTQASSLEETSSAIEEMNSMVGRNAQAARESNAIAKGGLESAVRGQKVVQAMMASMEEINIANKEVMRQTNESNQKFAEIVQVIHAIGNKTKVINEIVFQTKLLSFNASVEAARAGEHGKGFAVVAEEVGNLAQMSGNAAKDITALLDGSIEKVQSIINESKTQVERIVHDNARKVESGTKIASECRDVLTDIVQGITSVSRMVETVAEASDEQARGINEINRAINQLDQVTQQNASTSEEAASASEELSAQAGNMKVAVSSLEHIVRGGQTVVVEPATLAVRPVAAAHKPAPQKPGKNNVIRIGQSKAAPHSASASTPTLSRVSGSDIVPSENDSRFKDI